MTPTSPLDWSVWRFREEWPRSLAPAAAALGLGALGGGWALGPVGALLFAVAMAAAFATYLTPVSYRLVDSLLEIKFLGVESKRDLAAFRRLDLHPGGAFVSPSRKPGAAGALRGFWIHLPTDDRRGRVVDAMRAGLA